MDEKEYNKLISREVRGRKVRLLRPVSNGWRSEPAGTIATIAHKYDGFRLICGPCECCGAKVTLKRVPPSAVELLPKGEEA